MACCPMAIVVMVEVTMPDVEVLHVPDGVGGAGGTDDC